MPQFVDTLAKFISHAQQESIQSNTCDYKVTPQSELDDIAKRYTKMYEQGQALIKTISEQDLARCRKLYNARRIPLSLYADELLWTPIDGKWILVPAYVSLIREVEQLKQLLN